MSPPTTVTPQQENDSGSMSGSDGKKRNKLGYHRTAVACGHCRRRKIRCIPSDDSSEAKCQNCIRLKKECQFYPVDQNGSNPRKSRSDSRAGPLVDEPTVRVSASPDQPIPPTSNQNDTSHIRKISSSGPWTDTSGTVASPPQRLGSLHTSDQPEWMHSPTPRQAQRPSQPDSNTPSMAGAYWISHGDNLAMGYQQQQYGITTTSADFTQEPHSALHSGFQDFRHSLGRQSFHGMTALGTDQSSSSYRNPSATFPEIERSVTMPVNIFSQAGSDNIMHASPQLITGPGNFSYDYGFSQHNISQPWFSPVSSHPAFSPQYIPTHQERKYSQYST